MNKNLDSFMVREMSKINNYLKLDDVKKMTDDELISVFKNIRIESDIYGTSKSDYGYLKVWGMKIKHRQTKEKKKEFENKNKEYSRRLSHNFQVVGKEIRSRNLTLNWPIEDMPDDPLDSYYFQRFGKKDLVYIASKIGVKNYGKIEELINILKENIPKSKRKEIIGKILDEKKKNKGIQDSIRFCPICGAKFEVKQEFCPKCGHL